MSADADTAKQNRPRVLSDGTTGAPAAIKPVLRKGTKLLKHNLLGFPAIGFLSLETARKKIRRSLLVTRSTMMASVNSVQKKVALLGTAERSSAKGLES